MPTPTAIEAPLLIRVPGDSVDVIGGRHSKRDVAVWRQGRAAVAPAVAGRPADAARVAVAEVEVVVVLGDPRSTMSFPEVGGQYRLSPDPGH